MQLDFKPGRVVEQSDLSTVQVRDCSHETEAETISWCLSTPLESIKAPEHVLTLCRRNSGPVVHHRDRRPAITSSQFDFNPSRFPTMLDCIVNKVC